jgi:LasA protease
MNPAIRKVAILLTLTSMLLSACGTSIWGTYDPYLTPGPGASSTSIPSSTYTSASTVTIDPVLSVSTPTKVVVLQATTQAPTAPHPVTALPTISTKVPSTPQPMIYYSSQSGDSLVAVALHFGVQVSDITSSISSVSLPASGLLNPNTLLTIPNRIMQVESTPSQQIIPDSEVVYSPSAQSFDIEGYIDSQGGNLSTLIENRGNGNITGAESVQMIALGSSISPRMLLAIIQYYTGWVQGQPMTGVNVTYPLGYQDPQFPGLYQQLRLVVRDLLAGYYGWRDGTLTDLTFPDGTTLRLAPELNAGTVALQYMFARHLNQVDWLRAIDPDTGFLALFTTMFGDPWEYTLANGPLFPPDLTQPSFILPFEVGVPWTLTSGPHAAWEEQSALAALDFAPPTDAGAKCFESKDWVVAIAAGEIVRSENTYVVLDLDGDGYEQTGWVVLYQHIASKDRIPVHTLVQRGDRIGHASCDSGGGYASGVNVHIARKYNGEWVAAGDPLPFVLSGWTVHAGSEMRLGTMTKDGKTITASEVSTRTSQIIRQPGE